MRFTGKVLVTLLMTSALLLAAGCERGGEVYERSVRKAEEALLAENLFLLRQSIDRYYSEKGHYPVNLHALEDEGYLRRLPEDPILGAVEWKEIVADPETSRDPGLGAGIWDVKSLARGMTLDGKPYSDL